MKKHLLFAIVLVMMAGVRIHACDICGCGTGSSYVGILPDFHKHMAGMRYRYSSLRSHVGAGGTSTYLTTNERYHIAELWGGWNAGKRLRFMALVPYTFNERSNSSTHQSKSGIGDMTLTGFFRLLKSDRVTGGGKNLHQSAWIGGGIKLPTGRYRTEDKDNSMQTTNLFQLGTGSVDFSLNTMYDVRLKNTGLNVSGSMKLNTDNRDQYSYGNRLTASVQAYHVINAGTKVSISPNTGLVYEGSQKDLDKGLLVDMSGGNLWQWTAGAEVRMSKLMVGVNWQTPFSQNLARGMVLAGDRLMVHISVAF